MCGIIGFWGRQPIEQQLFNSMRDTLAHRGPDGFDSYFSKNNTVALGHRRLAFIDLSENGKQPIANEDETVFLTCNGEIYNYIELKTELETKGHVFRSGTDSEVILHGYEEWGSAVLNKLKGMFAFGIYDQKTNTMFLARDRFGIKPLYYSLQNFGFVFASEVKAIIKHPDSVRKPDWENLSNFLYYRFVPSPDSAWKNIYKIPPAHYLIYSPENGVSVHEYWEIDYSKKPIQECDFQETVTNYLNTSVKSHLMSEVPIGLFLSGGLDSATMGHLMSANKKDVSSYTIGFSSWENSEHTAAQKIAESIGIPCKSLIIESEEMQDISMLMYYYDDPIADISIIPTYQVSHFAAREVKAVLSGEGGDEMFAGYNWYKDMFYRQYGLRSFLRKKSKADFSLKAYSYAMSNGLFCSDIQRMLFHKPYHKYIRKDIDFFYAKNYRDDLLDIKRFQHLDRKSFMSELVLAKVDRASMANSLEVRVPFLDHELFEFVMQSDTENYFHHSLHKPVLKKLLQGVIPENILLRPKQGFVGPDSYYANMGVYQKELVENSRLANDGIVNRNFIRYLIAKNDTWRLWKLLVLEKWYSVYRNIF